MKASDDIPGLELMTRDELLELAPLDALGLLDDYDAALFTRSFHHATAAVQDEVRDLQAAIAADERLMAAVAPRPELRKRVLAAMTEKAAEASEDLAPLAVIGARRSRAAAAGPRPRHEHASRWRLATFALAAVLIAGFFYGVQLWDTNQKLTDHVLAVRAIDDIEKLVGADWRAFANDPAVERIALRPTEHLDRATHGLVYVNEDAGESFVLLLGLPEGTACTIVAVDADGHRAPIRSLRARGEATGLRIVTASLDALAMTWQVESPDGTVLMRS